MGGRGWNGPGKVVCQILVLFLDLFLWHKAVQTCTGAFTSTGLSRALCAVEAAMFPYL